ncbi:MAG: type II toxin-antitoxin system HipA family toxin [Coriobacteriales bacterium]|jgi:serine/threonine-protein kinase HipA|nr:type II toxin-antitoxin system HipA family toxin [Coriobacteriales bacterium]
MTSVYVYTEPEEEGRPKNTVGSENAQQLVGLAYISQRKGRLSSTFAYAADYLASSYSYAIDPELPLQTGSWPATHGMPGCLMDSAPDRWGRNLINKRYPGRRLTSLDYLLGVSDATRQGALRFKTEQDGAFQYPDTKIPKLVSLQELLAATWAIDSPKKGHEAVRFLLEAGSGSLGGARPKAVVEKEGELYLAKFPHKSDQTDVIAAEYYALQNARKLGMDVPECELIVVGDDNVLLVKRFDRCSVEGASRRVPYISAMTALGATDGEQRDYLEILDFISRFGSRPKQDRIELLKRIRYTIEINNTDDHLRNHGFIYEKGGWHLSPLFDINPNSNEFELRQTALGGCVDAEGSMQVLEQLESKQQII